MDSYSDPAFAPDAHGAHHDTMLVGQHDYML
jgi:hypothetical protein